MSWIRSWQGFCGIVLRMSCFRIPDEIPVALRLNPRGGGGWGGGQDLKGGGAAAITAFGNGIDKMKNRNNKLALL